jgi:hypothetical protein
MPLSFLICFCQDPGIIPIYSRRDIQPHSVILQPLKEQPALRTKCKDKSVALTPETESMSLTDLVGYLIRKSGGKNFICYAGDKRNIL